MTYIPLKQWAKKRKISRRKAEYLAEARPDLVGTMPQKIVRTVHVKCVDESLAPGDFALRSEDA
jgi:hypothetical protein